MSIIGPRPLLVRYLERYNKEQHHRHDVRPGLTGYAQAHGRNAVSWEDVVYLPRTPEISSSQIKKDLYDANAVDGESKISHDDINTNPQ